MHIMREWLSDIGRLFKKPTKSDLHKPDWLTRVVVFGADDPEQAARTAVDILNVVEQLDNMRPREEGTFRIFIVGTSEEINGALRTLYSRSDPHPAEPTKTE